jgi:ketosteroid isomerase-like protein
MSQENVAVVLASFEAYNAGDLDALMGFYASDVEVLPDAAVFPESTPLHGLIEFRAWLEEVGTAWVRPRYLATEVLDLGSDRVLRRGDWGGVGATSGIEMYSNITGVFTVRDGQISRAEFFFDHDEALKAVGLAE